jgi:tetratricopeptide (TPR) repeat protein
MGVVYRARQISLKREVALKLILGGRLANPHAVERFYTETEAVARLDHPNIVPIYEVGQHEGLHYFTMKLLEGGNLAEWNARAKDRDKAWQARAAQLLAKVARAVHFGHQRGILHRDLKPANILLDASGEPYVGDFGLAKLAGEASSLTASAALLGTPHYMAPEQALGGLKHLTVAADIYSLGAVLYELLAGRPAFAGDSPMEVLRQVVERAPQPPRSLQPKVDRDLETICLKCLEKEPASRYPSADALAQDLEHWLAGRPIQARPASLPEKLWRWCRREPALASLLTLLVGVGLVSFVAITWQWRQARQNALAARTEAEKNRQTATFLKSMLEGVGPGVARGRDTTLLKEILEATSGRIGRELTNQPLVEAELLTTIGEVYRALSMYGRAEAAHRRALTLREQNRGRKSEDASTSMDVLGVVLLEQTKLGEAEPLLREALAARKELLGPEHPAVAGSLSNLGVLRQAQGRLAEAEALYLEALEMRRKLLGTNHLEYAESLMCLASVLWRQHKDLPRAEAMNLEAVAIRKTLQGDQHPDIAGCLNNLATVYMAQGKQAEAEAALLDAGDLWRRALGENSPQEAQVLHNLGWLLWGRGKREEGERAIRRALEMRRKALGNRHDDVAQSLNVLAVVLQQSGRFEEAERIQREQLALVIELHGPEHLNVANAKGNLGWALRSQKKLPEAESLTREALALQQKLTGPKGPDVGQLSLNLGVLCVEQGKLTEAEKALRQAVDVYTTCFGTNDLTAAGSRVRLARLLYDLGKYAEAEEGAAAGLEVFRQRAPEKWTTFRAEAVLGRCLLSQSNYVRAEQSLLSACRGMEQRADLAPAGGEASHREAIQDLATAYRVLGRTSEADLWEQKLTQMPPAGLP